MLSHHEQLRYLSAAQQTLSSLLRQGHDGNLPASQLKDIGWVLNRLVGESNAQRELTPKLLPQWRTTLDELRNVTSAQPISTERDTYTPDDLYSSVEEVRATAATALATESSREALRDPRSDIHTWYRKTVNDLIALLDAVEDRVTAAAMATLDTPDASSAISDLGQALDRYFSQRFPHLGGPLVLSVRALAGGSTNITALVELRPSDVLPERVVLRCDGRGGQTGSRVADEFGLLELLYGRGVPVPQPLLAEFDRSALGGSFMLLGEIRDATDVGESFTERELGRPSALTRDHAVALARLLAKVHSIPGEDYGPLLSRPPSTVAEDVLQFKAQWDSCVPSDDNLASELAFAWLLSHPLEPTRPACLVHADAGPHNLMISASGIAALLDWELAHSGDPAEDLGYVRGTLVERVMTWPDFCAEYIAAGGNRAACDDDAVNYYAIWGQLRNSVYVALLRQAFVNGARTDVGAASIIWDLGGRVQHYLCRALANALAD